MNERIKRLAAVGIGGLMLSVGVLGAGAQTSHPATTSHHSVVTSARSGVSRLAAMVGIGEQTAAPGTIDDGKELLPQAGISLDQAVAAAQGATSGDLGEVDLEQFNGVLVFNVDIGQHDVKVDAQSGVVLNADVDREANG